MVLSTDLHRYCIVLEIGEIEFLTNVAARAAFCA
jgi:hypothetical protein